MAKKTSRRATKVVAPIVIDQEKGLIFKNEKALYEYFTESIDKMEALYLEHRKAEDFSDEEIFALESYLELTLDEPDEVWRDAETLGKDLTVFHYMRKFEEHSPKTYYIASCYIDEEENPTFIFLHFATQDVELVHQFRRGELAYDKTYERVGPGAVDGDGLVEGDPLAIGLYLSMTKVRSEKDIQEDKFHDYSDLREDTIENADEIWRAPDMSGNLLVTFIKSFPDHESGEVNYVVVTQEDPDSNVHALLYSFPTNDENLLDRFRHGENLQAEEVVQESSH
jgi:hypothetical protein